MLWEVLVLSRWAAWTLWDDDPLPSQEPPDSEAVAVTGWRER